MEIFSAQSHQLRLWRTPSVCSSNIQNTSPRCPAPGIAGGQRSPWRWIKKFDFLGPGGMHPWLDVVIVTSGAVIGVESKRYEPFRSKGGSFSEAYWRPVWGSKMTGYECCRDEIRDYGGGRFTRLNAAQLVKHAFALRTAVHKELEWVGKRPVLFYLYAEPERWPADKGAIPLEHRVQHQAEITEFWDMVRGDEVTFHSCCYSELLPDWAAQPDPIIRAHAAAVARRFLV